MAVIVPEYEVDPIVGLNPYSLCLVKVNSDHLLVPPLGLDASVALLRGVGHLDLHLGSIHLGFPSNSGRGWFIEVNLLGQRVEVSTNSLVLFASLERQGHVPQNDSRVEISLCHLLGRWRVKCVVLCKSRIELDVAQNRLS